MSLWDEVDQLDATDQAYLVRSGQVTASEMLDAYLGRLYDVNPSVNAVIRVMEAESRVAIANGLPDGPFEGVPFLLKDLFADYAGVPTTQGSRFYEGYVPTVDSTLVSRYKAAGLVIFGKTNTPEFGGSPSTEPSLFGPTLNPWDPTRSAGGSSGGSGAAVAAGMAPMAHGSDGGGSLRVPASVNGLFGLKPSRGRNPAGPHWGEFWNGMLEEHAITRSVRDSARLLDFTHGAEKGSPYLLPRVAKTFESALDSTHTPLRIAFTTAAPSGAPVDPNCVEAVEMAAALCEDFGHIVTEEAPSLDALSIGEAVVGILASHYHAMVRLRSEQLGREPHPHELENVIQQRLELARTMSSSDFVLAMKTLHQTGRRVAPFFDKYELFLSPTLASPPIRIGVLDMSTEDLEDYLSTLYSYMPFTNVWNIVGYPACSVPIFWSPSDHPIGVQIVAPGNQEDKLLRVARQFELAVPWAKRRPALSHLKGR